MKSLFLLWLFFRLFLNLFGKLKEVGGVYLDDESGFVMCGLNC